MKSLFAALALWILFCFAVSRAESLRAGPLAISPESWDLIIYYETGGPLYYTKSLQRPCVPPGESGITIGVGYDLRFNTPVQIRADWGGVLPARDVERLAACAGLSHADSQARVGSVRDIVIPWEAALQVFKNRTVPRFAAMTAAAYPGVLAAPANVQGVMLSTSFNRGTAMAGDRRRELRWSRDDIGRGSYVKLPEYQLQMRRLWPTIAGLRKRYTAHAGLMQSASSSR